MTLAVTDPEKHLNEVIRLGGREIIITRFITQCGPTTINLGLSLSQAGDLLSFGPAAKEGSAAAALIYFTLTDSTCQKFIYRVSRSRGTILVRTPNVPYVLTFAAPPSSLTSAGYSRCSCRPPSIFCRTTWSFWA